VHAVLDRPLAGEWPYLWLDATYYRDKPELAFRGVTIGRRLRVKLQRRLTAEVSRSDPEGGS
jgi:hypothetical protein